MKDIVLITNNLDQKLNHNLTLSDNNEAFFDIEKIDNNRFYIKLFLSNVYLTIDKYITNDYIEYISLKLDTMNTPLAFYKSKNVVYCIIDDKYYYLKIFNYSLCLVSSDYNKHKYYLDYNSHLVQDVLFVRKEYYPMQVNTDIQLLLSEYLIRESTNNIFNKDEEPVYNIDDIINIILVYNNCRAYAFISGFSDLLPVRLTNLIKKLGLFCIPNYNSDEMFITKIKTDIKKYSEQDIGKKLGFLSYMYYNMNDKKDKLYTARLILKSDLYPKLNEQIGVVEVFTLKYIKLEDINNRYDEFRNIFEDILKLYINDISLTKEIV